MCGISADLGAALWMHLVYSHPLSVEAVSLFMKIFALKSTPSWVVVQRRPKDLIAFKADAVSVPAPRSLQFLCWQTAD